MSFIKKFEEFDFSQTLPVTSRSSLTNYYSCEECNALWKEFNKTYDECKFCKSDEIENLSSDEWYELIKSRLEEDEIKAMENERKFDNETLIDITSLKGTDKSIPKA